MPAAMLTAVLALARRVRPLGIAIAVYEIWRRLPRHHRRRLLRVAGRSAPRVALALARRRVP